MRKPKSSRPSLNCEALVTVTVRLKSTRLPKKAILPLGGKRLLAHLIDRLKHLGPSFPITLATSDLPQDDALEAFARDAGVRCFRGDSEDVLARILKAAQSFGASFILSVTGDNPFVDAHCLKALYDFHRQNHFGYSRSEGLPFGAFGYALTTAAVEKACGLKASYDTEVWGGYFTQNPEIKCGVCHFDDPAVHWPELRLTVDTPEDFALAEAIVCQLEKDLKRPASLAEIVAFCRSHPELVAINQNIIQKAAPAPVFKTSVSQSNNG